MPSKTLSRFVYVVILSILTVTFGGCQSEKKYRIGVSQCSDDDWRTKMNEEIRREAMFHDNIEVEIRSADDDSRRQIEDIRYFAENDFDIIIAAPNEANALTPIIKEVYESGTPVLLFDRNINGDTYTAFQGADNEAIGRQAAEVAASIVDGPVKVLEIKGLKGSTPSEGRNRGFVERAGELQNVTILASAFGNWNDERAQIVADSLLRAYPEANLIYAHNDRMAIAAKEAASRLGRGNIKIIGIDAAPEIGIRAVADKVIDATFLYPTNGYKLMATAINILEGRPYEKISMLPSTSMVDHSNAEILLRQNEDLKEETRKVSDLKGKVDEYFSRHSMQTTLLYFVIGFLVLLCLLIFVLLRAYWQRRQTQEALAGQNKQLEEQRDREIALNEKLRSATQSKLMFFTNVSHDLRTPLTLIAGPVEQLNEAENLTPEQRALAQIAKKNVKVLHRLINQILDFRKYENDKIELNLSEADLGSLLREWCDSFIPVANRKNIRFSYKIDETKDFKIAIDVDKIERVVFNLISNAFKYTPSLGSIDVELSAGKDSLVLRVADSGRGISAEDLSHIFERFYQVERVHPNGSGIGLSLAKAFIELHDGTLTAQSEEGKGSVFTVTLPLRHVKSDTIEVDQLQITPDSVSLELDDVEVTGEIDATADKPTLLIIDDNADLRAMTALLLKDDYHIISAGDGASGLKMASSYVPDLIICDVMMPVMDGLECCRHLKGGEATSHIPVLMLTACSMDEQRIQGYQCGADAYLSKPFNPQVLQARCKSLIDNRKRIHNLWRIAPQDNKKPQEMPVKGDLGPVDNELYARFCNIVEAELANPDISIDAIAGKMNLGRTQFYRKIKAISGYAPVELLRNMRLAKARHMLTSTGMNISEIAYQTGFSTPAYFGKCYKDRYNETPSETREKLKLS